MAGRGPDERLGRLAHLDRGEVKARPSGFPEERPERRNATGGAPERRACRSHGTRHLSRGARPRRSAAGAPPPQGAKDPEQSSGPGQMELNIRARACREAGKVRLIKT